VPSTIPGTLADDEREALYDFFRSRIDKIRDAGTAGDWVQQLDEVLDYRRWHRFVVQMRVTGGEWVTVTRRQHGAKTGGEKTIVLHLPLFAAAAAHYRSAPEAPRRILLDEVVVGMDSTNRGQLKEVLAAFDLDLVLTSDTEWCTYPEPDGRTTRSAAPWPVTAVRDLSRSCFDVEVRSMAFREVAVVEREEGEVVTVGVHLHFPVGLQGHGPWRVQTLC
jgi:hypothetical protein